LGLLQHGLRSIRGRIVDDDETVAEREIGLLEKADDVLREGPGVVVYYDK